jgi:hypothetical protein
LKLLRTIGNALELLRMIEVELPARAREDIKDDQALLE